MCQVQDERNGESVFTQFAEQFQVLLLHAQQLCIVVRKCSLVLPEFCVYKLNTAAHHQLFVCILFDDVFVPVDGGIVTIVIHTKRCQVEDPLAVFAITPVERLGLNQRKGEVFLLNGMPEQQLIVYNFIRVFLQFPEQYRMVSFVFRIIGIVGQPGLQAIFNQAYLLGRGGQQVKVLIDHQFGIAQHFVSICQLKRKG